MFSFTGEDLTGHIMAGFSFKSLGLRTVENVVPRDYLAMFFEISGGVLPQRPCIYFPVVGYTFVSFYFPRYFCSKHYLSEHTGEI